MARLRGLREVEIGDAPISRFRTLLEAEAWSDLVQTMARLRTALEGHAIWNVNSTARGGGVAELLIALVPYSRGAGVDERWVVIEGAPEFFDVTKTLHNFLHGVRPAGADLGEGARWLYEHTMSENGAALLDQVRPGDVAVLHDPQTAGLAPVLRARGVRTVWRSHIGVDAPNDVVREGWAFLQPYVRAADAAVFTRLAYVWDGLQGLRIEIIPPCIDPFAPKNSDLEDGEVTSALDHASLPAGARYMLQVSRWDRLKDPAGVLQAFAEHIAPHTDAFLVLAGPAAASVGDDPEQPAVLADVDDRRGRLPSGVRERVLVAQLPMDDIVENATIVNALQRRAAVVVQKSIAEGFGLTVAEAMWKSRPVVASRVGGIEDQIEHGRSGLLVDDPRDLQAFGEAVVDVLRDEARAAEYGREARQRVARLFITPRHLIAQGRLIADLYAG